MLKLFIILLSTLTFNSFCIGNVPSLSDFLKSSKAEYQTIQYSPENREKIHFVMGNESGDLDSIVSSISLSYFLHFNQLEEQELYLPLLNLYREEIELRKDVLYLFQLLQISVEDLLFLDDQIPLDRLFDQDRLRLTLVDHNVLRPRQEHLSKAVERIVDHHVDENKEYPLLKNENKLIAIVGSAATLVANQILENTNFNIEPEFATLLLAPILIDTANLQSPEKTTEKDQEITKRLQFYGSTLIPAQFYETLLKEKNDVIGLTPAMLLSKDFKEYLDGSLLYGISSLPSTVSWWTEDLSLIQPVIEKFAVDRGLAFLILLMNNQDPNGPKRKIIVYSPFSRLLKAFDQYIESNAVLSSMLLPQQSEDHISFYWAEQFISRKQLQPLFHFSQDPNIVLIFEEESSLPSPT